MSWVWQVWCWQYHCLYIHDNHSSLPCPIMSWVWQVCCWHCQCHCLYLHDNHTSLPCPGTCDGSSRAGADKLLGPLLQGLSHVQLVFVHDVVQRQEVLLQSVDQRDGELVVHHLLFRHYNQPMKKKRVVPWCVNSKGRDKIETKDMGQFHVTIVKGTWGGPMF